MTEGGRALAYFPVVKELDAKVTAFLIPARRCITEICQIPRFLWEGVGHHSALSYLIAKELEPRLGPRHHSVEELKKALDGMARISALRDGQEHQTTTKSKPTRVHNFAATPANQIVVPCWHLEGDAPTAITREMPNIVDFLLCAAEAMFIHCLHASWSGYLPICVEPVGEPDPKCPVRVRVVVDVSRLGITQAASPAP